MATYRQIRPAAANSSAGSIRSGECESDKLGRRIPREKAVKIACRTCQRRKVKCDGLRPQCNACKLRHGSCCYDGPEDSTRYQNLRANHNTLRQAQEQNRRLLELLRVRAFPEAMVILEKIRDGTSVDDILDLVAQGDKLVALFAHKHAAELTLGIKE